MKNSSRYQTTKSKSLMRSLFLIAIASFIFVGAYAQAQTPVKWTSDNSIHTLNCTEEAVSLKLFVKPGWHINSLRVGNGAPVKTAFESLPFNLYSTKGPVIKSDPLIKYENESDMGIQSNDTTFKLTITSRAPKATNVLDKLSYIPWVTKTSVYTSNNFTATTINKPLNF